MFAVIKTGGKQYSVAEDQTIELGKLVAKPGEIVTFPVMVLGGDKPSFGTPLVSGALVAAEVVRHTRGATIIAFKKRRRQNSRRRRGHRQDFTVVRITEILTDGKKANKTAQPRPKRTLAPKPKEASDEASAAGSDAATEKPRTASAKKPDKAKSAAAKAKKPAAKGKRAPGKGAKKK